MNPNNSERRQIADSKVQALAGQAFAGEFDHVARLACALTSSPAAAVCALGPEYINVLSEVGLGASQVLREGSFCAYAIESGELFEVPDATADARFAHHPMVDTDDGLRSYCGVPFAAGEVCVGTVFVVDNKPRQLAPEHKQALVDLAKIVADKVTARLRLQSVMAAKSTADAHIAVARTSGPQGYELLARATHKLRAPLQSMLMQAGEMGRDQLVQWPNAQLPRLARLESDGYRMVELLDRLFELSRLETADGRTRKEPVGLSPLIESAIAAISQLAQAHAIRIVNDSPDTNVTVLGDETALRRALSQLLSNAVLHNRPCGHAAVRVTRDATTCSIWVTDHGPGLSPAQIAQLFQPLHRLENSHADSDGCGLGLFICDKLVSAMGGRLSVKSEVGKGASFEIQLPLA